MKIEQAQESLEKLFFSGAFVFDESLPTITEYDYANLINTMTPEPYQVAYEAFSNTDHSINVLENLFVDLNEQGLVDLLRRERTYVHRDFRIFQLQLDTVPKLIVTPEEPKDKTNKLTTTWWVNSQGRVVHYRVVFNGNIQEDCGIFEVK